MIETQTTRPLPYGISDFKQLRRENKYYVDKTMFLPRMEDVGNFLFFIRPRRFGKSIFLSMMRAYYDINERDNFDTLFDGLWIKDNPTGLRNSFEVLHLDFSQIGGSIDELKKYFDSYMDVMINDFAKRYADRYPEGYLEELKSIHVTDGKLNFINQAAKTNGHQMYLIIDEYDNFANTLFSTDEDAYRDLTHGD